MGRAEAWAAFPRRRLRVRASGRQRAFIAFSLTVALAALAASGWFAVELLPHLVRDATSWSAGRRVSAGPVAVACGTERSLLAFAQCRATGPWTDGVGRAQRLDAAIVTLFGVGDSRAIELRVDPAWPGEPMVSVFVEELPLRALAAALAIAGLAFLGALVAVGAGWLLRDLRAYRALARNPWPVEATVLRERIVANPEWAREVRFRARLLDGREIETTQRLAVAEGTRGVPPERWTYAQPIVLGGDPTRLLALVDDRQARLLIATLEPLELSPVEREAVTRAAAAP